MLTPAHGGFLDLTPPTPIPCEERGELGYLQVPPSRIGKGVRLKKPTLEREGDDGYERKQPAKNMGGRGARPCAPTESPNEYLIDFPPAVTS
jgi:hypothetical protein